MKAKKKSIPTTKKPSKKPQAKHNLHLVQKTLITTKEKTYNTLEDPVQIKELKFGPRSARNNPSRLSCLEKMQECNISPFSSPNRSSFSPQLRKTLSPSVQDEKERLKVKAKTKTQTDRHHERRKSEADKAKIKSKMTKEQCNFAYQNQFLKKLGEKKITERSQESQTSAKKLKKLTNMKIQIPKQKKQFDIDRTKLDRIRELKKKIVDKYRKDLPSLKTFQMNFFCSIVLIQRLWKQRRIKKFISQFISPRSTPECNVTCEMVPSAHLDYTLTTEAQTSELIRKYHTFNFEKKNKCDPEVKSIDFDPNEEKINLKELELSSELTPERQTRMVQFVECLRDITFHRPPGQKKKQKINVFNLQQSLSEKCLMQTFYERVFKQSPAKVNNFELFKSKKEEKNLERSIELIQSMGTPNKQQQIIMEERFETQLQSKQSFDDKAPVVVTASISVQTDPYMEFIDSGKEINSLKQLSHLSEGIIGLLLNQFCEEYHDFASKSTLRKQKKKKGYLPGIRSSQNSIRIYLSGLIAYMFEHYGDQVVKRFSLINPLSFLKIHHEYDEDEDYIEQDQEEDLNSPIIPQNLFYEYQQIYEDEHFFIPEDDKSYTNFLSHLIKVHNLSLSNCLSEMVEKLRMERMIFPWDAKFDPSRNRSKHDNEKALKNMIDSIVDNICSTSFMKVGQLRKIIEGDYIQEERLLRSINMEYKSEGSDWATQLELLELRMEITSKIEDTIFQELITQLSLFM